MNTDYLRKSRRLMSFLSKMSVGVRFRLAFGGMVFILLLTGAANLYQAAKLDTIASDLGRNAVPSGVIMANLAETLLHFRQLQAAALLASTPEDQAIVAKRRSEALADIQTKFKAYEPFVDDGEERTLLIPAIETAWKDYQAQDSRLQAVGTEKAVAAHLYIVDLYTTFRRLQEAIKADMDYSARTAEASVSAADTAYARTAWTIGGMTGLGITLAIAAALWLNRSVISRVVRLAGVTRQLASRDYVFDLPCVVRTDEIGEMARAIDACRAGLREADTLADVQRKDQQTKEYHAKTLDSLVRSFESKISNLVSMLSSGANELKSTAGSMSFCAFRSIVIMDSV